MPKYPLYIIGVSFLVLASPTLAHATMHQYTCADGLGAAGAGPPSCVNPDVLTFPGGGPASLQDNVPRFAVPDGTTIYATYTETGSGALIQMGNSGNVNAALTTGTQTEEPHVMSGMGGTNTYVFFYNTGADALSGVCLDDDGFSCSGGPPPTPPAALDTQEFDTGTTTCTVINASTTECINESKPRSMDSPIQDLFYGFVIFFATTAGIVSLFRKK